MEFGEVRAFEPWLPFDRFEDQSWIMLQILVEEFGLFVTAKPEFPLGSILFPAAFQVAFVRRGGNRPHDAVGGLESVRMSIVFFEHGPCLL